MAQFVIGLDSGTQSTKALLVDAHDGRVLARTSAPHRMLPAREPGEKEQDPADWLAAADRTIGELVAAAGPDRGAVVAIGLSGQQHGFVPLDAEGRVIRPAKLWCDTSTAAEAEALVARLGGLERTIALTGNGIPPGYTASKILWLKEHEPERYARLATVLLPHDYLVFELTGARVMEYGDASGTALMDVRRRVWSREAIAAIDPALEDRLPPLGPSDRPAGRLRPEVARRWGLCDAVLVTGSGDNMMAAIGTGNVREGVVTASLGTSGTVYACAERPIVDPRGELAAFCDATNRWLPLACTMNVTVATELMRRLFRLDHDAFTSLAASAPPGAGGLVLVPFFEGERTPNCPEGTGVLLGLREATFDPACLARAAMEGVTIGLNYGLRRLRELGIRPREIRLTGGGARNALWRQIAADVFECPIVCPVEDEGAAYGAALHALWVHGRERGGPGIGELVDRHVALDETTRAEPDARRAATYRELQAIFEDAAARLGPTFARHRAFVTAGDPPRT